MTSAVFDFKEIHDRMLGDNKPKWPDCLKCEDAGWIVSMIGFVACPLCLNPEGHPCP